MACLDRRRQRLAIVSFVLDQPMEHIVAEDELRRFGHPVEDIDLKPGTSPLVTTLQQVVKVADDGHSGFILLQRHRLGQMPEEVYGVAVLEVDLDQRLRTARWIRFGADDGRPTVRRASTYRRAI